MAEDQTAFRRHFYPVDLGETVFPSSPAGVFPPRNMVPVHHLHSSSRGPYDVARAVSPVANYTEGMAAMAFPILHSGRPADVYTTGPALPRNVFREHSDASSLTAGIMTPRDTPGERLPSPSSKKVKILCSFGGKILPRPSDGALRYVGGHTRIIALHKNASLQETMSRMEDIFGGPAVLKYQLPGEDLDSLVSVSCPEDLENMIEEYDKLQDASPEGCSKLRVFLFSPNDEDVSDINFIGCEKIYVELVNYGMAKEAPCINRKGSAASLSSTQVSDGVPPELSENTNEAASHSISIPTLSSSAESPDTSTNPLFSMPVDLLSQSPPAPVEQQHHLDLAQNPNKFQTGAAVNLVHSPWYPYIPVVHVPSPLPPNPAYVPFEAEAPVPPFPSSLLHHASPSQMQSGKTPRIENSDLLAYPNVEDNFSLLETSTINEPRMSGFDSQVGNYFPMDGKIQEFCMSFEEEVSSSPDDDIKAEMYANGTREGIIKLDLQAIAEDVASSVLQQSSPDENLAGCEDVSLSTSLYVRTVDEMNLSHQRDEVEEENSLQDFGPPDEQSLDFQALEGISHLQTIKNGDIEELEELGSGTFGTVYHGKWKGSDVAIKRINSMCFAGKKSEQERMRTDFWNEACKLADLHHPNVVAFYGVVLDGPGGSVATVTEFMVNGSLRQALQRSQRTLDRRKRLIIAMDVACGMEYLHGKNIVHFDLKSDNLLVNLRDPQRPICKVGDLGLSKVKRKTLISGGVRGTLPWMAPELLNGSSSLVSEKVDVFSFAIVMWELLTAQEPYADLHYGAIIGGIVNNTLRPQVPESCDPGWRSLMERCWSSEPSERPSFARISLDLRAMPGPTAEHAI